MLWQRRREGGRKEGKKKGKREEGRKERSKGKKKLITQRAEHSGADVALIW